MSKTLDQMAEQVASDQAAIDGQSETTRERVLRMGKRLRQMQKEQKKEQAETGQTWDQWIEEQKSRRSTFPAVGMCRYYMLISRYPRAYKKGMSIKEAYKQAGKWKKNGGSEPAEKMTIKQRPLITVGAGAGKLARKIDALLDGDDLALRAREEEWTEDEIFGAADAVTLLRQSCNHLLKQLKEAVARVNA